MRVERLIDERVAAAIVLTKIAGRVAASYLFVRVEDYHYQGASGDKFFAARFRGDRTAS
jgi:hypothetical protein